MTVAPERAHPGDLGAVRARRAEHDGRHAQGARRVRDALAEVARRHAHDRPVRPDGPLPRQPAIATHVPRPLNERIGLTVSTLTMTGTPRRADRPSWTYCGESREGRVDPTRARRGWPRARGPGRAITARPAPDMKTPEGTAGP